MATARWGGWTGAAAHGWAGEEPSKGVLGVSSTAEGISTPPHLMYTQSPFVLRSQVWCCRGTAGAQYSP